MRPKLSIPCCALSLLLSCAISRAANAESPGIILSRGNADYQSGDFASAERAYRLLLDQGVDSGAVYYNVGNACFKQKKLGEAIYYWEKARRRLPGDSDVLENLQLANMLIVDRIDVPDDPLPVRILSGAANVFTVAEESRIVLVLFILANVLFGVRVLVRQPRIAFWATTGALTALLLLLLFGSSMVFKVYQQGHRREGVIVEQKVDIRSGPGTENVIVVTVHEGIVVRVRGDSNGWYQITLPNGWNGWLPETSVRIL